MNRLTALLHRTPRRSRAQMTSFVEAMKGVDTLVEKLLTESKEDYFQTRDEWLQKCKSEGLKVRSLTDGRLQAFDDRGYRGRSNQDTDSHSIVWL